jgi:hypothetical protein
MILFFFFFVGVWWLQPRIKEVLNKLDIPEWGSVSPEYAINRKSSDKSMSV